VIFGKYINRYYLRHAPALLLGILALLMVDYIQLLVPPAQLSPILFVPDSILFLPFYPIPLPLHQILSASVQGLEGGVWDDRNVYQSGYFMVDGNILDDYKLSEYMLWDYGFDFYAPQSFETEDGRRVHISWMGMPDCEEYTNLTIAEGWQHCFTFPREVFVEDGKVCQRPVRELQKRKTLVDKSAGMLKKDGYKVYDVNISGIQNNEFRTVIDEEMMLKMLGE